MLVKSHFDFPKPVASSWRYWGDLPLFQKMALESLLQASLLSVLLIVVLIFRSKVSKSAFLLIFVLDLFVHAWICLPHTGVNIHYTHQQFKNYLRTVPKGYPVPDKGVTSRNLLYAAGKPTAYNLAVIEKQVDGAGYNPFHLRAYSEMMRMPFGQNDIEMLLPDLVYFPTTIRLTDSITTFSTDTAYTYNPLQVINYEDTTQPMAKITLFKPGQIRIHVKLEANRDLMLMQNYYPGWKAFMNKDSTLEINVLNNSMQSVRLPAGDYNVEFRYQRIDLIVAFVLEIVIWVGLFIFLLISVIRKRTILK
jgi:hypothetical protein